MRGIVTVTYLNGKTEAYEVNNTAEAITIWSSGMTQICADENNIVLINNNTVFKIVGEPSKECVESGK